MPRQNKFTPPSSMTTVELIDKVISQAKNKHGYLDYRDELLSRFNNLQEQCSNSNSLIQVKELLQETGLNQHIHDIITNLLEEILPSQLTDLLSVLRKSLQESIMNSLPNLLKDLLGNHQQTLTSVFPPNTFPKVFSESSYADAVKTPFSQHTSERRIFVNSSNPEDSLQKTEAQLNKIFTKDIDFTIRRTRTRKLLIQPATIEDKDKILDKLNPLSETLQVTSIKPKQKNIIIFNAPKVPDNEEDLQIYFNDFITPALEKSLKCLNPSFSLLRSMKTKNNLGSHLVLRLEENIANYLINISKIQIGFSICNIQTYHSIHRCTNCQSFSHLKRDCVFTTNCHNCGSDHNSADCTIPYNDPNQSYCINCHAANRENYNHAASWSGCPIFQSLLLEAKKDHVTSHCLKNKQTSHIDKLQNSTTIQTNKTIVSHSNNNVHSSAKVLPASSPASRDYLNLVSHQEQLSLSPSPELMTGKQQNEDSLPPEQHLNSSQHSPFSPPSSPLLEQQKSTSQASLDSPKSPLPCRSYKSSSNPNHPSQFSQNQNQNDEQIPESHQQNQHFIFQPLPSRTKRLSLPSSSSLSSRVEHHYSTPQASLDSSNTPLPRRSFRSTIHQNHPSQDSRTNWHMTNK